MEYTYQYNQFGKPINNQFNYPPISQQPVNFNVITSYSSNNVPQYITNTTPTPQVYAIPTNNPVAIQYQPQVNVVNLEPKMNVNEIEKVKKLGNPTPTVVIANNNAPPVNVQMSFNPNNQTQEKVVVMPVVQTINSHPIPMANSIVSGPITTTVMANSIANTVVPNPTTTTTVVTNPIVNTVVPIPITNTMPTGIPSANEYLIYLEKRIRDLESRYGIRTNPDACKLREYVQIMQLPSLRPGSRPSSSQAPGAQLPQSPEVVINSPDIINKQIIYESQPFSKNKFPEATNTPLSVSLNDSSVVSETEKTEPKVNLRIQRIEVKSPGIYSNSQQNSMSKNERPEVNKSAAGINSSILSNMSKASNATKTQNKVPIIIAAPTSIALEQRALRLETKSILSDYGTLKVAKDFINHPNSEYNQLLMRLRSTHQKFKDTQFPAEYRSLVTGKNESEITWDARSLVWLRPDEFYGKNNYKIHDRGVSINDIKQGDLGDYYFLSTLAALVEFPHRIEKLIVQKDINEEGCYAIRICDMGEWQEIILDDYFPCYTDDKSLAFSKGNGNKLWVSLLEKAWAKLYGSYAKIEAGLTREALHDLTGAPTRYYNLTEIQKEPDQIEKLWRDLVYGDQQDFILTCGNYGNEEVNTKDGILFGYAYSIISVYEINLRNAKLRLLKIRNPHSHGEWTGPWSDSSPLWTPEIKAEVNYKNEDGTFFMSFNDFFDYFEDVEICKIHDDYNYSSLKVTNTNHKNAAFFAITIKKGGKYYITANQQSKRHHEDQENFEHSPIWMFLARADNLGGYELIEGVHKADREVFTDTNLIPGEYIVSVKASWYDKKIREFVLGVYGPDDVIIRKMQKNDHPSFIQKIFIHKARKSKKTQNYNAHGHPNCIRASESTDEGYVYFYYQNRSNKTLIETVDFSILEGRKLVKPNRGTKCEIRVAPGEEKIILLKDDYWAERSKHSMTASTRFEQSS